MHNMFPGAIAVGSGAHRGGAAVGRRGSCRPGIVEALERRTLMAGTVVSVNADGRPGNDVSDGPAVTPDGRFVAFVSRASDLAAGVTDANRRAAADGTGDDVFLRDRATGTTTLVSRSAAGAGNASANALSSSGGAVSPSVSDDGRFVAFHSRATDLVAGVLDLNDVDDVFVRDTVANTTRILSADAAGRALGGSAPDISGNGRFVAFHSRTDPARLVPGAASGGPANNVFVFDLQSGSVALASQNAGNTATGNSESSSASISGDGRFVAFESLAGDLVAGDTTNGLDVFLRDMQTGATEALSLRPDGTGGGDFRTPSYDPAVSADGRFVTFASAVEGLVPGDANGFTDVFLRDTQTDTTTLVSAATTTPGTGGNAYSQAPSISPDGRFVSFFSMATDLASATSDVRQYVRDTATGQTFSAVLVPTDTPGTAPDRPASVTADGRVAVVSPSRAAPEDTNAATDVYLVDPLGRDDAVAPTASLASSQPPAVAGAGALDFVVVYTDNVAINPGGLGFNNVEVVPPGGGAAAVPAMLLSASGGGTATVIATYRIFAPGGGTLDAGDSGAYTVNVLANRVGDVAGNPVAAGTLGTVQVAVEGSGAVADLVPVLTVSGPATVVGGAKGRATVRVTNAGAATASGPLEISLYASTGPLLDLGGSQLITTTTAAKPVTLRAGASKTFKFRFTYPTIPNPDGSTTGVAYTILAAVDEPGAITESDETNNVAAAPAPVTIAPALADLSLSYEAASPATAARGGKLLLTPALRNLGNAKAAGTAKVSVLFSTDPAPDLTDAVAVAADRKISLKPGGRPQNQKIAVTVPPDLAPGTYTLIVILNTLGSIPEPTPELSIITAPMTIVIT